MYFLNRTLKRSSSPPLGRDLLLRRSRCLVCNHRRREWECLSKLFRDCFPLALHRRSFTFSVICFSLRSFSQLVLEQVEVSQKRVDVYLTPCACLHHMSLNLTKYTCASVEINAFPELICFSFYNWIKLFKFEINYH